PAPFSAQPADGVNVQVAEGPLYSVDRIVLLNFDGTTPPTNGDGDGYPNNLPGGGRGDGGKASVTIDKADATSGHSLRAHLTEGELYLQFNPYNYKGDASFPPGPRAFAREYAQRPAQWRFNTYNRMRFWIKCPTHLPGHRSDGRFNANVG